MSAPDESGDYRVLPCFFGVEVSETERSSCLVLADDVETVERGRDDA